MSKLEDAIVLATKCHEGQVDKIGEPYILHPLRVMMVMNDEESRIVAILHDILEDTKCSSEVLKITFGKKIYEAVIAMSKINGESYEVYINRVMQNPIAKKVKIADVKDNASPIRLYRLEPKTIERLTAKYSKTLKILEGWENENSN
jgi:(p)ppGpp synthase/HD superfamily hydrolase